MDSNNTCAGLSDSVFIGDSFYSVSYGRQSLAAPPSSKNEEGASSQQDWVYNGSGDNELTKMRELAEKSTVIMPGLRFNASLQYAGGVVYGYRRVEDGNEWFEPAVIDEIDEWLELSRIHMQLFIAMLDIETFGFSVPQFVLSRDKSKIARMTLEHTRAPWVRMARRDKMGDIRKVFVNADYGTSDFKKANNQPLDIAPSWVSSEYLEEIRKKDAFGVILRNPDLGRQYYTRPDWMASVDSGWYDLSQAIAESKLFWMKNQFGIKYHIEFHPEYWKARFGADQWAKFKDAEKLAKKEEELKKIVKFLQGTDKQGSTFFSELFQARGGDREADSLVKINELKNIVGDGHWMKESNESSDHMLSSLMIHPELIGNAPGSKMGAGSGSANRVAFNQRVALSHFKQEEVLSSLNLVKRFNGWPKNLVFKMRNSLITTLDTGAQATKPKGELPSAE